MLNAQPDKKLPIEFVAPRSNRFRSTKLKAAKKIGLETEKTMIMDLIESGEDPSETENVA